MATNEFRVVTVKHSEGETAIEGALNAEAGQGDDVSIAAVVAMPERNRTLLILQKRAH